MRKRGKFSLSVISIVALVSSLVLSGCGNSSTKSVGTSSKPITITMSMWDPVGTATPPYIKAFEKKYPNIKVNILEIPVDYSQKIHQMIAAKDAPDVILSWEADVKGFAQNGVIEPLDNNISKTNAFKMSDMIPAAQQFKENGKIYGLPWCYATEILYYNKDMFDQAHIPYPNANWTWQDYENTAKKLTIRKNGKTIQWGSDSLSGDIWYSLIGQAGDEIVDKNGNLALSSGLVKTLQFQNQLTNVDKVSPRPSSGGQVADLFAAGKAAMTRNGSWYISAYQTNSFKWGIAPLPKEERAYNSLHTGFFTINSSSKYKQADWDLIQFLMSKEGQTLIEQSTNNPSAEMSVAAEGAYKVSGKNGPSNWDAMTESAKSGQFGYVLANPTVTTDLANDFDSVILGQQTIKQVMTEDIPKEQAILNYTNSF